ncbi:MAG TPA: S8 family serine peptidase [Bacilli bacterium]|nr:S8 family serine peptidase [Bacilli bacterium]
MKKKAALAMTLALGMTAVAGFGNGTANAEATPQTYLVVFKQTTDLPSGYASLIEQAGGTVTRAIPKLGALEVVSSDADFLNAVQGSPLVQEASVEHLVMPEESPVEGQVLDTDAMQPTEQNWVYEQYGWDIKQVTDNGASWNLPGGTGQSVDGKDIVIGIIDSGIDYNHPDIKPNYLYGKSFVPGITDPIDQMGHGTHIAGSIAAHGAMLGIGPDLKLASYRVFGPTGGAATADIAAALMTAADDNVDVVNMSMGDYYWLQDPQYTTRELVADKNLLDRAIQYAINQGVTVVSSAGNAGANLTNRHEMSGGEQGATQRIAGSQTMIRVASNGEALNRAWYSNYGVGMIDVTAPGGDLGLAWLDENERGRPDFSKACTSTVPLLDRDHNVIGHGYAANLGTSMAAPKAAALAGVIIAQHGKDVLTPAQVKHIIQSSTVDLNKPGYDAESGFGLINAVNALK